MTRAPAAGSPDRIPSNRLERWKNVIPGSWLNASVCIDVTKQIRFAMRAVCGISSLIQAPSSLFG